MLKLFPKITWLVCFIVAWSVLLILAPSPLLQLVKYAHYSLLGVLGAIFANSTGAGGGVVFIPAFHHLAFSSEQSIATSLAIQCFGMTAGAITWGTHYQRCTKSLRVWQGFTKISLFASCVSVLGVWFIYSTNQLMPTSLHYSFSWFSLILGGLMLLTLLMAKPHRERSQISKFDWLMLALLSLIGGMITAWLSVGVGELLAIYLILRRFDITMAVSIAVVVSAVTVWSAIWQHTVVAFHVVWQVVIFAGPSAILGGIFAKTLVSYLSARKLKLFFACWLLIIGMVGI